MPLILPPPEEAALMLDMDGTLLDIASTPDSVVVEPGLVEALVGLREALGGALAVVTGRPIAQVDALLPGVPTAVAGEHGGAIRIAPGADVVRALLPDPPVDWVVEAAAIAAAHPGVLLEQKQRGFVLHYRLAPEMGGALHTALTRLIEAESERFTLLAALMAWEVKPRGADKGSAVRALAVEAPFAGRRPVFIGDDVTDEDGMAASVGLGGAGLRVQDWFGTAGGVRAWLAASAAALAAGRGWPEPAVRAQ